MSNEPKLKIEFENKQNSILYNDVNSKFLLTAENVNEIKEVVNNLSDSISSYIKASDTLKYLTFIIPQSFDDTSEYSFKFQVATNLNFTNPIEYSLSGNSNNFKIFKNNIWSNILNNKIVSSDFGNALQLNIDNRFPSLSNNTLVGRYQWINLTNNESTNWFGCGIQNTTNYDTNNLFNQDLLIDLYLSGKNTLSSSESETYQLIGVNENDEEINLTSNAVFRFDNEELDNNKITAPQIIDDDSIHMLFANVTYNNKKYATSLAILFKSSSKTFNIQLSKHNLSLNESIIFTATLNNSNIVPNIEILNQSENFELNINNNQITAIKIIKNENVMIKFSYTDENNKNYEKIESITLNYEEKTFNVQLESSSLSLNDLNLSATTFIATLDNNEINDYNNLSSNILNQTDRFKLTVNKTNKKIEANKVLDFEKIIIEFLYKKDGINYQKIVNVDLIPKAVLTGLIINCNNQVSEPNTLTYSISGTYSDNTSKELNSNEYTVSGSQSTINKSTKTVTLNFTSNKETLIFESNGIKESKTINLNLLELYDLSGNIPISIQYQEDNWSLTPSFKLQRNENGQWSNVNCNIEEIGAIKYFNISNGKLTFKNNFPEYNVSTCLKATYTDSNGKTISKHFAVEILNKMKIFGINFAVIAADSTSNNTIYYLEGGTRIGYSGYLYDEINNNRIEISSDNIEVTLLNNEIDNYKFYSYNNKIYLPTIETIKKTTSLIFKFKYQNYEYYQQFVVIKPELYLTNSSNSLIINKNDYDTNIQYNFELSGGFLSIDGNYYDRNEDLPAAYENDDFTCELINGNQNLFEISNHTLIKYFKNINNDNLSQFLKFKVTYSAAPHNYETYFTVELKPVPFTVQLNNTTNLLNGSEITYESSLPISNIEIKTLNDISYNLSTNKIIINEITTSENAVIIFKYAYNNKIYECYKTINLVYVPNVLEINVSGCELIDDNTKLQITYTGTLNDSQINGNNLTSILLDNPTDDIILNHNIITINDITTDKIFNVKFTYNNIENIKQISTKIIEQNNE